MAGFKDFTPGEVLTAADVDGYLMAQAVIQCTSATHPSSPHEGMVVYETDNERYMGYTGSSWELIAATQFRKYKSASESINTSTVLQDDNHLTFTLPANTIWLMEGFLRVQGNSTMDYKMRWDASSGSASYCINYQTDDSIFTTEMQTTAHNQDVVVPLTAAGTDILMRGMCVAGAGATTQKLQWAQNTSNGSNLTVLIYSWIELRRIV